MVYRKSFDDKYAFGKIAEGQIAQWLIRAHEYQLLPAYEIEIPSGKGPRLLTSSGGLVAPDILAMKHRGTKLFIKWYEAKHKTRFSWYRKNGGSWQTGIDLRHFEDYIKVQEQTGIEVYMLFLHRSNCPSASDLENGSPSVCPVGLFGGSLYHLIHHVDHKDSYNDSGRAYPMVYWNEKVLKPIASLEEMSKFIGRSIARNVDINAPSQIGNERAKYRQYHNPKSDYGKYVNY
jgi:hypothetical protein